MKLSFKLFNKIHLKLLQILSTYLNLEKKANFNRYLPFNENLNDRWKKAKLFGFGDKSSVYDSCFVFGEVNVGIDCWIGPNTILDGSGGLTIGDFVTISAGCQIYSHDSIIRTLSSNKKEIKIKKTVIGNNVYLAPNCIVRKGVTIGDHCVVANGSYVNNNVEKNSIVAGNPARKIGEVLIQKGDIKLIYFTK